jgi:fibro-slime domain-containing protein
MVKVSLSCILLSVGLLWSQSVFLPITIRDFPASHSDFQAFPEQTSGQNCGGAKALGITPKGGEANHSYTPGMVETLLGEDGKPVKTDGRCASNKFDDWFNTIEGVNLEIKDSLELNAIGNNQYQIKIRGVVKTDQHKDGILDGGFFPLDDYPDSQTFGKENPALWCPTEGWQHSLCDKLTNPLVEFHNYGFTIEGQLLFDYVGGEVFQFLGDDDMWIFIDGKLQVDLGGVHLSVSGEIDLDSIAKAERWESNTVHTMQFFYAERQSEGSNLTITTTLNNIQQIDPSGLEIKKAEEGAAGKTIVYLNSPISASTIAAINSGGKPNSFQILSEGIAYEVLSIKAVSATPEERKNGVKYEITWNQGGNFATPVTGDQIKLDDSDDTIISAVGKGVEEEIWIPVGGIGNPIEVDVETDQITPIEKAPFSVASLAADNNVGSATKLNKNQGVDWLISAIPLVNGFYDAEKKKPYIEAKDGFGVPSANTNADDCKQDEDGSSDPALRNKTVNGLDARCFCKYNLGRDFIKSEDDISNCMDVSFEVSGPFKAKIQIFSHLGAFVRESEIEVTAESLVQYGIWEKGDVSVSTDVNGESQIDIKPGQYIAPYKSILVNAGVYPTPESLGVLGTGVYIIRVDLLQANVTEVYYKTLSGQVRGTAAAISSSRIVETYRVPYRRPSGN